MNKDVSNIARCRVVMNFTKNACREGRREEALKWYAKTGKMSYD